MEEVVKMNDPADKMMNEIQLGKWRTLISEDPATSRFAYVFDKIVPDSQVMDMSQNFVALFGGRIPLDLVYSRFLVSWTYGYAKALTDLSDENITLHGEGELFPEWPASTLEEQAQLAVTHLQKFLAQRANETE